MELDEYIGKTIKVGSSLWIVSELRREPALSAEAVAKYGFDGWRYFFIILHEGRTMEAEPDQVERSWRAYMGGTCASCDGRCEWDHFLCENCR